MQVPSNQTILNNKPGNSSALELEGTALPCRVIFIMSDEVPYRKPITNSSRNHIEESMVNILSGQQKELSSRIDTRKDIKEIFKDNDVPCAKCNTEQINLCADKDNICHAYRNYLNCKRSEKRIFPDRDKKMVEFALSGKSLAMLSAHFNINKETIRKILITNNLKYDRGKQRWRIEGGIRNF